MDFKFEATSEQGNKVSGYLLKNKLATYIITEDNPHECTMYGYIEIDEYQRVDPKTVKLIS